MAQKPTRTSGSRVSNIMGLLRGNFDFKTTESVEKGPIAYGSSELISAETRSKILSGALKATDRMDNRVSSAGSLLGIVQSSLSKVGHERLENRKILQLVPEVDKAARLMIASMFSPNDLTRHEIAITFNCDGITDAYKTKLEDAATSFFQKKLNLKTAAPSWVYQFGYETGACIFAIIPLRSFEKIEKESYIGTESFVEKVIEPLSQESFFGFGDNSTKQKNHSSEIIGLESFTLNVLKEQEDKDVATEARMPELSKTLLNKILATESLSLTDNPSILQASTIAEKKRTKRTSEVLSKRFKPPLSEPIVAISSEHSSDSKTEGSVIGNPILMRLPPESVTVIHTPGEPSDHQGYLVLLDALGNPISALSQEHASSFTNTTNQSNIFAQTYNAYGLTNGRGATNEDTMSRIYSQVVLKHLHNRLDRAGFNQVELSNLDSVYRCLFTRFLQQKQTRILFLPKELVTYMTFQMDENGYGVSRLDKIKFNLGMKMAVQVSRVLAGIKAAMDRRRIEIKFTDNLMESPESVFQNVIREYVRKNTMSFSIDPNVIQNQIADKSISIKGTDIPGMESFDLTNEPDQRSGTVDFDPGMLEYIDKAILNGLGVPAAAMNSLDENEYARSVTTTNLFFSMEVSIDQDITIKLVSDLLRKYARYSEDFAKELGKIVPSLAPGFSSKSSTEDVKSSDETENPFYSESYTIDTLIDCMSIALPKPNVAPSKAQFESLEAMTQAITNLMVQLFPDDLAGSDDTLRPVITMLRSKFTIANIRAYLDGSGMSNLVIPDTHFSPEMKDLTDLNNGLRNIAAMLKENAEVDKPAETENPAAAGY